MTLVFDGAPTCKAAMGMLCSFPFEASVKKR